MKLSLLCFGLLKSSHSPQAFWPRLEVLESRTLLSVCTVDRLTDNNPAGGGEGSNGLGDLRYCLTNAGNGDDITFGVTGTINLAGALPDLTHSVNIEGPGADLVTVRRDTGGDYRIFTVASGVTLSISGLTIANGHLVLFGAAGAGIANQGTLTLSDSTVADNRADGAESAWGGGILNRGTLTIINSLITRNIDATFSGGGGAGIANAGTLIVTGSTLSANAGGGSGNGILNYSAGMATVSDSTVSGNTANDGGGIANQNGTVTVNNSTIAGNMGGFGDGGIENLGMMAISNSTLFGNAAEGGGGGIGNGGTLTITNSTISGNANSFGGRGGGVFNAGALNVRNTIVAGNSDTGGAPDLSGTLTSSGYNLIGNTQGGSGFDTTDLLNVDPLLGPLQDNGGPAFTMALLPGSPALNAGDPNQLGSPDQRGVLRSGGVNIGAYQASASRFVLTAPARVTAGMPFDVTVTAVDIFGQVAAGYRGTVTFSTTDPDPGVVLPADYPFTAADGGVHTFTDTGLGETTLRTRGRQTITATDTGDASILGRVTVKVRYARHASPPWKAVADQQVIPSPVPARSPTGPAVQELSEGQLTQSEAVSAATGLVLARQVQDVAFEGMGDPVVEPLAARLVPQGW
jgi:hypothetical protein